MGTHSSISRRGALAFAGSVAAAALAALSGCATDAATPTVPTTSSPAVPAPATSAAAPSSIAVSSVPASSPPVLDPTNPPSTVPATSAAAPPPEAPASARPTESVAPGAVKPGLRPGAKGAEVVVLQKRLNELGFWVGVEDGDFGLQTRQGVAAAQKAAGIPIDAVVGPITTKALNAGIALTPRTTSGRALEVDKERQLLLVVDGGRVTRYYNTSTGGGYRYFNKGSGKWEVAETPSGSFSVFRQVDAWDPGPLGAIYRPMYFNGGIAVHGTNAEVLDRPKSHGCVRLTLPMMDEIRRSGQIAVGTKIVVY